MPVTVDLNDRGNHTFEQQQFRLGLQHTGQRGHCGLDVSVGRVPVPQLEHGEQLAVGGQLGRSGVAELLFRGRDPLIQQADLDESGIDCVTGGRIVRQCEHLPEVPDPPSATTVISPSSGTSCPTISRSSVDLPEPFSPTTPVSLEHGLVPIVLEEQAETIKDAAVGGRGSGVDVDDLALALDGVDRDTQQDLDVRIAG